MEMDRWPELPYSEWKDTCATLHMYTQVIGKLRLALSPFEPEWANVPLYVTARGLSTSPVPAGGRTFDAEFDFIDHALVVRSTDGGTERRPLGGSVAEFYEDVVRILRSLQVEVAISIIPSEVSNPIPFPDDRIHNTYVPAHVERFHQALTRVDAALKAYRAGFRGRTTPVHFFWGSFDLAVTRYSGRPAQPAPGAGVIERMSGDAEQICAGWWPGNERVPYPAFFAYAYPRPEGIESATVRPWEGVWDAVAGEFLLPYEAARSAADPQRAILDFLTSTYEAGAELLGWDPELTDVTAPPPPGAPAPSHP
jgi:hypothetical protein